MKTLFATVLCLVLTSFQAPQKDTVNGAWGRTEKELTEVTIFSDGFFSAALYHLAGKKFVGTYGGKYKISGNALEQTIEYDTRQPDRVGTVKKLQWKVAGKDLMIKDAGDTKFTRVDPGTPGELAGAWLITGRYRDNEIRRSTPGARRTMKILSGTRFQWIAYNVDTKEFFGTGGGTYTTVKGKYTENIEFFSRDSTRVGVSLGFDFSLENGEWRHKGLSSKGEPIDEIWTPRSKVGL